MKYLVIVLICLVVILLISILYSCFKIDINSFLIRNNKIDKNMKIMFLSDLHNRNLVNRLSRIIEKENPDLVILGGDMVNESIKKTDNFFKLIDSLNGHKTYYVFGNHEEMMSLEDKNEYIKRLNSTNIILLNNDNIRLSDNIRLFGLDSDYSTYKTKGELGLSRDYIISKIGDLFSEKYNILVSHNPLEFNSYIDYGCDLVLSGHIHGGIIRLPFIGGLLSPDYTFRPKYYQGKTTEKNTSLIVSRGLGFSKVVPFRINNPAEVVIINLEHSEE